MWSQLFLCVLVSLAAASDYGWKSNTEYVYQVRGRTLTGLYDVADEYSGIILRAELTIRPKSEGVLTAKIAHAKYAQLHTQLPGGWNSYIPESQLSYKPLPLTEQPFQILLKNGVVHDLIVSKQVPNWEANIIKSFVSQIQLDTQGENVVKSHVNQLPEEGSNSAVFKTMEDTVTGEYETLYDITPLPEYILQSQPWLAPFPQLKGNGEIIEIVKNKNFSRNHELVGYHFGLSNMGRFEPNTNQMGEFFSRSSISRAIISGTLKRYVIQCSETTNKIVIRPTLNNKQHGIVVSHLNVTLSVVQESSSQFPEPTQPQHLGNLIYRFDKPFSGNNEVRPGQQQKEHDISTPYGSSSSSSSSSSEESHEKQTSNRQRRSARSSSSSSSSYSSVSSEEYWQQDQPKLNSPPETPLLSYFVGYKGQSIKSSPNFNVRQVVQKLCQEIANELQRPEEMPKEQTLAKFTILSSVTRIMDEKEMQEVARELYTKEKQGPKCDAWKVYRDAVAECGTGPALLTIQNWIQNKQIKGEEAAEIVATMTRSVRQPTEEYMRTLYALVTKSEVQSQAILNDTAILSYSYLIRKVYVSGHDSHNQYPVHSFGTFRTKAGREFVTKEYIPYLNKQLNQSIDHADSHKTLVYIRALGNVAHQEILNAFEPYLEGRKQISQFQRLQMVVALDKLCKVEPRVARSVLYKIYQNAGEEEEIRVAAVYRLIRTNPPASMLQRMAQYTNVDTDEHVNAAVQSSIKTAANLKGERYYELRENARSAEPLLTRKHYGAHYSHGLLRNFVVREMNLMYKQNVQSIGSDDSYVPKGLKYTLQAVLGGARRQMINVEAMVSSIDELTNVFERQTESYKQEQKQKVQQQRSEQSQWSSESIARKLNIQIDEREQLEGALLFKLGGAERYFSFDNHTIEYLPHILEELETKVRTGITFQYSKLINRRELVISFPTEMAFPFIYNLDNPTLLRISGDLKASVEPKLISEGRMIKPKTIAVSSEIRTVVSTKVQSELGFVTPFDHYRYSSGYDKNIQIYLPLKSEIHVDIEHKQLSATLEPIEAKNNARLFHYSSWPYTCKRDILKVKPVGISSGNQIIYSRPQHAFHDTVGQKTGMAFRIDYTSEQRFADAHFLYEQFKRHDIVSALLAPLYDETIQYSKCNIYYQADKSVASKVQVRMGYKHKYVSEKASGAAPEISQFYQLPNEPKSRQEQFAKMASAGIPSVKVTVGDVVVEFQGQRKVEYSLTAAYARSLVDPQSRVLFFLNRQSSSPQECKPYQLAVAVKSHTPNTNGLDFLYALKFDPKTTTEMKFAFGESYDHASKVNVHAELRKSESRKRYLQSLPQAHQCRQEMQEGNHQLHVCANLTASANLLDRMSVKVQYENITPEVRNCTEKIYKLLRHVGYFYQEENFVDAKGNGKQNELDIEARFDEDFRALNVSVRGEKMDAEFKNIRINDWAKQFVVFHPVFSMPTRVMGKVLGLKTYRPICVVDETKALTFDNKTYPIDIGNSWTVMFQYLPQYARYSQQKDQRKQQQIEEYVVLVRDGESGHNHKEVRMTVRCPHSHGKMIEIEMKPSAQSSCSGSKPCAQVFVNKKQYQFNDQQSVDIEDNLIRFYALPNGDLKVEVEDYYYIIYDGHRVKLTVTTDKFHDAIRGLCGTFDGEAANDFTTPQNCVIRDPYEFAATYAVEEAGKVQELKARAQKSKCYYDEPIYANVISAYDAGRVHETKQHKQQSAGCTKHQTRYVEDETNHICFTVRPIPVCKHSCQAKSETMKTVPVHCVAKNNVSEIWRQQIDKGASPDFSLKPTTKHIKMQVPQHCSH